MQTPNNNQENPNTLPSEWEQEKTWVYGGNYVYGDDWFSEAIYALEDEAIILDGIDGKYIPYEKMQDVMVAYREELEKRFIPKSLLTQRDKELVERVEGMKGKRWIEHGRDCLEGKRPCGAVDKPDKLADRCGEYGYDEKTLNDILTPLQSELDELLQAKDK